MPPAVHDLRIQLGTLPLGGPPALSWFVPAMTELLGFDLSVGYGLELTDRGFALPFFHAAGRLPADRTHGVMHAFVTQRSRRWGMFDPLRPEPKQRNVATRTPPLTRLAAAPSSQRTSLLSRLGVRKADLRRAEEDLQDTCTHLFQPIGVQDCFQLRALVCDRQRLVAWVGGFRDDAFTDREAHALESLLPALAQRLTAEERLQTASLERQALSAAMEHIPAPAFLLSAEGRVREANAAGRAVLDHDRTGTQALLREAARTGVHPRVQLQRLCDGPQAQCFLAVLKAPERATSHLVASAAKRWSLTPRQTQVLALLAEGQPNQAISAQLGCAVHTVELHVSAILNRAGVANRAALVAELVQRGTL